jgi:hypothetical protein
MLPSVRATNAIDCSIQCSIACYVADSLLSTQGRYRMWVGSTISHLGALSAPDCSGVPRAKQALASCSGILSISALVRSVLSFSARAGSGLRIVLQIEPGSLGGASLERQVTDSMYDQFGYQGGRCRSRRPEQLGKV